MVQSYDKTVLTSSSWKMGKRGLIKRVEYDACRVGPPKRKETHRGRRLVPELLLRQCDNVRRDDAR